MEPEDMTEDDIIASMLGEELEGPMDESEKTSLRAASSRSLSVRSKASRRTP